MAAPLDQDVSLEGRLWRVEQRQADVLVRLVRLEERLEVIAQGAMQRTYAIANLEKKVDELERRRNGNGGNGLTRSFESALVRTVVFGLLALVAALAAGKALSIGGLFGG